MCRFFSAVVIKDKVLFDMDIDSHEDILVKFGLKDNSPFPNFVRVEVTPKDGDLFNHDLDNWEMRVDQDTRPDWFDAGEYEAKIKTALKETLEQRFIINDDTWQQIEGQR